MEEHLVQAQKMEAIGTLAGGIAHDFNNLLGVVIGNVSHALGLVGDDHPLRDVLTDVQTSSLQAQGLTQQLLTFAKGGEPIKRVCDINKLLRATSAFSTRGSKSKCRFELSYDLWPAEVDKSQIEQVLNNLVINANQAMPQGGTITIRSENVTVRPEHDLPLRPGRYVTFSVEDTGIGIPPAHLPNVFEPYFSTKQDGSGLGLATAYSIIKRHDGYLAVTSELDKGSVFRIHLPAAEGMPDEPRHPTNAQHRGSGKILIMDDQESILTMVQRMLVSMGYEATGALNGFQAVERYQEARSAGSPFKAVILDLTIPGSKGGLKTVKELAAIDPTVKAIVSSGYSNDPVLSNYEEYGFCGMLPKPYTMADLAETLTRLFGETT